jgi:hypothetical protein
MQTNEIFIFCRKTLNVSIFPPNQDLTRRVVNPMIPPDGMEVTPAVVTTSAGAGGKPGKACSSKRGKAEYCSQARHIVDFTVRKEFTRWVNASSG